VAAATYPCCANSTLKHRTDNVSRHQHIFCAVHSQLPVRILPEAPYICPLVSDLLLTLMQLAYALPELLLSEILFEVVRLLLLCPARCEAFDLLHCES
jgi:hypothetical protein